MYIHLPILTDDKSVPPAGNKAGQDVEDNMYLNQEIFASIIRNPV